MPEKKFISIVTIFIVGWLFIPQTLHEAPPHFDGKELYAKELLDPMTSRQQLPVLVLSGGRLTCSADANGDPIYNDHMHTLQNWGLSLVNIASELNHRTPIVVVTCFHRSSDTLLLRTSLEPDRTIAGPPSELANYIRKIRASEPSGIRLFMYGHSYGGHLALKTVADFGKDLRPEVLMTADPISANDCYLPDNWQKSVYHLRNLSLFSLINLSGCRRFPADLNEAELSQISSSKHWIQTWQEQMLVLHSAGSPKAHVNFPVKFGLMTLNAHDDHAVDRRILDLFKQEWTQNLRSYATYALQFAPSTH